jgi:hypothetical protein
MIAYSAGFDPDFVNSLITKYGLPAVRDAITYKTLGAIYLAPAPARAANVRAAPFLGSDEKWDPASAYPAHVFCVLRIGAQEILLDQALHRNKPKYTQTQQDGILQTVGAQQEGERGEKAASVHGMAHVCISAAVDEFALRGHEADVAPKAQACPDDDQQTKDGDCVGDPLATTGRPCCNRLRTRICQ